MLELLPLMRQQFFDDNGAPLAGGKLYSYLAGTSTPMGTFQDPDGETPNTNPIILDAGGRATVYINTGAGAYKFILTDSEGAVIWTADNVAGASLESVSGWYEYDIIDGQDLTPLEGQTIDFEAFSSGFYDVEITRGTTVVSCGLLYVNDLNGAGVARQGVFSQAHGVSFDISQDGTEATLMAAADSGAGNGKLKLSRRLVPR